MPDDAEPKLLADDVKDGESFREFLKLLQDAMIDPACEMYQHHEWIGFVAASESFFPTFARWMSEEYPEVKLDRAVWLSLARLLMVRRGEIDITVTWHGLPAHVLTAW